MGNYTLSAYRGLDKTKEHIVAHELQELTAGKTFADVQDTIANTYIGLSQLGVFDKINIQVDASDEVKSDITSSPCLQRQAVEFRMGA